MRCYYWILSYYYHRCISASFLGCCTYHLSIHPSIGAPINVPRPFITCVPRHRLIVPHSRLCQRALHENEDHTKVRPLPRRPYIPRNRRLIPRSCQSILVRMVELSTFASTGSCLFSLEFRKPPFLPIPCKSQTDT